MSVRICPDCHNEYARLERDGLCPACHQQRLHDQHQPQGTIKTIIGGKPPIDTSDMAEYCRNGHKWGRDTTRWRFRDRGGRHGRGWERDCLLCKQKNDGRARMDRNVKGRNVTIVVNANGTHWNSGRPGGKEY